MVGATYTLNHAFTEDGCGTAHDSRSENLLGYKYYPDTDSMTVSPLRVSHPEIPTKRLVLSFLAKVFDPMGLYLPVVSGGKPLMREIHKSKLGWDSELPDSLARKFEKLFSDILLLSNISFNRKISESGHCCSLVIFTDASKELYGFAAYLLDEVSGSCNLYFSKCKIAPIKSKTLPTLELLAVFLAFKCLQSLLEGAASTSISKVYVAIDSQVAISWVVSKVVKSKNIFARNRVKDIHLIRERIASEFLVDVNFKYIPTDQNPADLVTRGLSYSSFYSKLDYWKHGPEFLTCTPLQWPVSDMACLSEETKRVCSNYSTASDIPTSIFPLEKFSTLNKLLKVTTFVLVAAAKFGHKPKSVDQGMAESKHYWIKFVQRSSFSSEIEFLSNKQNKNKNPPPLVKNLNLFIDNCGIVRSRGRLAKCLRVDYNLCNPILLPKDSFLTTLFVRHFHEKCLHMSVTSTLNKLRNEGYWIPHGRQVVRRVLSQCVLCKKFNSRPFLYPKLTDFVADRVNFVTAYKHVGVDFTGHLNVKFGEQRVKMYLLVFTCLNVRAVHIQLLPSMSSLSFLLAFVRFSNQFGIPDTIYSDNAASFLQSTDILNRASMDSAVFDYLVTNDIKHVKIPLYSAWVGSAWERLIRVIKTCLYKSIGRKVVDYFSLVTLLSDVENVINSRPLSYTDMTNTEFENSDFRQFGRSEVRSCVERSSSGISNKKRRGIRILQKSVVRKLSRFPPGGKSRFVRGILD